MGTDQERIEQGRAAVKAGALLQLRQRLRWSQAHMAEAIGVNAITYRAWEAGAAKRMWSDRALKLGRFLELADRSMKEAVDADPAFNIRNYTPLSHVAVRTGRPHEVLLAQYRAGQFPEAVDLGVLGIWLRNQYQPSKVSAWR